MILLHLDSKILILKHAQLVVLRVLTALVLLVYKPALFVPIIIIYKLQRVLLQVRVLQVQLTLTKVFVTYVETELSMELNNVMMVILMTMMAVLFAQLIQAILVILS